MAGFVPSNFAELIAKQEAKINDLTTANQIAGWGGPTAIGAGLGALTAPKNKGLQSTLRGAGLGAALHAGTSLGARAGSALAGGSSPTGALVGAGVGGLGSTLAAQYLLPRVDDDEDNKKEKSAMSLYSFGAKLANYVDLHNAPEPAKKELPQHEVFNNALTRAEAAGEKPSPELFARIQKEHDSAQKKAQVTGMTYDPDNANVKRLKAQHPNNWRQVMAKSQGLSDSSMAKAIKKAQSTCSPCAMPNGPTNKPYTSASPAVTDASQASKEIGKPPVTETEHSAAKAKLPEEGVKVAVSPATMLGGLGKKPAPAPARDMFQMHQKMPQPQTVAPERAAAPTGINPKTHPIAAQSQTAANNAFTQFGKTWNPMDAGRGIYNQYMSGMQHDGETLGNAYGAARNFIVNNSKGPNMLQAHPGMTKTQSALEFSAKSAFAFGAKVAAGVYTPTQLAGDDISYNSAIADERANLFLGSAPASQTNLLAGNKLMDDQRSKWRNLNALRHDVASYKQPTFTSVTGDALKNWGRNIYNAGDATAKRIWRTGEDIASYGGPRNALDSVIDNTVNVTHGIAGLPGKALRAATGGGISPQAMAGAGTGPGGSAPSGGAAPAAAGAGTDPGTGAAGGGILETLYNNRYPIAGGLGALGLGGLLYYLNSQPKKKKRDEEEV